MMKHEKHFSKRTTPQSQPIPGKDMVPNSAGGYAFAVDDWMRMLRFLILGSEGGTYYIKEGKLTRDNAMAVERCIAADGKRAVDLIVEVSNEGRAIKNDPAIFALALAASAEDQKTRAVALANLDKVCRIPTHLAQFANAVQEMRGWGRSLKRGVGDWFKAKPLNTLAMQTVKYRQREGWTLKDLLRLSHAHSDMADRQIIFQYIVDGLDGQEPYTGEKYPKRDSRRPVDVATLPEIIQAYEQAKTANKADLIKLIRDKGLTREMIPNTSLDSPEVWEALLERMPLWAMLRNLGKMSSVGLLKPLSDASKSVCERLGDAEALHKARVHPMTVLLAAKTYASGHGVRGKLSWSPVSPVVDALDQAFYKCFKNVEPTGKNILCALDVSGSMSCQMSGTGMSAMQAAAAMALVLINVEPNYHLTAFSDGTGNHNAWYTGDAMIPVELSKNLRIDTAVRKLQGGGFGRTDCSLPMRYAQKENLDVDVFEILTDSETWFGRVHPTQALVKYRQAKQRRAKLAVLAMTSNEFSIADPNDADQLDLVGFDTNTPKALEEFIKL
jgi:60 kDa SS-A/Ro ribonucleoprotein